MTGDGRSDRARARGEARRDDRRDAAARRRRRPRVRRGLRRRRRGSTTRTRTSTSPTTTSSSWRSGTRRCSSARRSTRTARTPSQELERCVDGRRGAAEVAADHAGLQPGRRALLPVLRGAGPPQAAAAQPHRRREVAAEPRHARRRPDAARAGAASAASRSSRPTAARARRPARRDFLPSSCRLAREYEHFYGDTSALNLPTRWYAYETILNDHVRAREARPRQRLADPPAAADAAAASRRVMELMGG